ncbi:uncharacterized protein LOC144141620 [Haemaphysalis longicornis]
MLCPGSSTAGPSHQGLPGRSRGGARRPGCYRHRPAVRYKIRPGLNPGYRDVSPQVSIRYYRQPMPRSATPKLPSPCYHQLPSFQRNSGRAVTGTRTLGQGTNNHMITRS